MTMFFRFVADTFFVDRYGHRAVVLETVAGVPGMVAGVLMHFKSLRSMKTGYGEGIREMLAEAENERMHLMFFIEITKPNYLERLLVFIAQVVFGTFYLIMYLFFTRTSHRMIGYFEKRKVLRAPPMAAPERVFIGPGEIAFTRIFCGPKSLAR